VHFFDLQLATVCLNRNVQCAFAALVAASSRRLPFWVVMTKEGAMKALTLLTAAALILLSVASSYAQYTGYPFGKGKAPPPPPVVTKG